MATTRDYQAEQDRRNHDNELVILRAENLRLKWELERAINRLRVVREHLDTEYRQKRVARLLDADKAGVA
jgi:hypothetical protein